MWNGIDNRKFPRYAINIELNIAFDNKVNYYEVISENLGIGGVCFISDKCLESFQEVTVKLLLPDNGLPIECNGRITWIVEKHELDRDKKRFDVGLEFVNINSSDQSRIKKIITTKEGV